MRHVWVVCVFSLDSSATSCGVGVVMAWSSSDSQLSGLLDCWSVWGLGARRPGQPPVSPAADTGMHLVLNGPVFTLNHKCPSMLNDTHILFHIAHICTEHGALCGLLNYTVNIHDILTCVSEAGRLGGAGERTSVQDATSCALCPHCHRGSR